MTDKDHVDLTRLERDRRLYRIRLRDVTRHLDKLEKLLYFIAIDGNTRAATVTSSGRFFHVGTSASAAYLKTKSFKEYLETQIEMIDAILNEISDETK